MNAILCLLVVAQCPTCGSPVSGASDGHFGRTYPKPLTAASDAFCVVLMPAGGGESWRGSGVLLAGEVPWVVTAGHVVRPGAAVECIFRPSGSSPVRVAGKVHRHESASDAAIIRLESRPDGFPGIPVARYGLARGEHGYAAGFGGDDSLRFQSGVRIDRFLRRPDWFELTGHARQGDSGGPVLAVRKGKVTYVGCIWGTDQKRIIGTRLRVFRRLFGMRVYDNENTGNTGTGTGVPAGGVIRSAGPESGCESHPGTPGAT